MFSAIEFEPKGLFYRENYLTQEEHDKMFDFLQNNFSWDGQIYNYRKQIFEDKFEPIPDWLQIYTRRLVLDKIFDDEPNQIIINKYRQIGNRNWSIPPHIDSAELFGKVIASITLGNACIVEFCKAHHEQDAEIIKTIAVKPRSIYFMTGESRYNYYHRIPDKKYNNAIDPKSEENVRISLTFRNVL